MPKKRKTALKNFRFTEPQSEWLKGLSRATGQTQTRIITDALKDKYKAKGFPYERTAAS